VCSIHCTQGETAVSKRRQRTEDSASDSSEETALEALYSPEYLRDCADAEARQERIAELKRRIEADAYKVDADRIAEELLLRGDLS
jgi:anti-sigma28 factor (negative regulator of flagellin synthesis)